ncbi:MAG: UDP-N-acetylmuramoyl-tripeptide--D-alanyl-D-alanine ligase [Henriciella sp.]
MSEALWTSAEIVDATGGRATAAFSVTGVSIDSRNLKPGDLFIALQDVRDGHDFVAAAFAAGASAALVSRPIEGGANIIVPDVLQGLSDLARAARERASGCYRVAVTGSVGKTSVKDMIATIFKAQGRAHWSEKSFNNQWGVPLTLARMPRDTEFAVFEVGMSTPGEIAPRSELIAPHTAMVTKIAPAHLEGLGNLQAVAEEKAQIYSGLVASGVAVVPADDTFADLLAERAGQHQPSATKLTFGHGTQCDSRVLDYQTDGVKSSVSLCLRDQSLEVDLPAVGAHWADNVGAAMLACTAGTNIDPVQAAEALATYRLPTGRGTAETLMLAGGGRATLIDDAYNANPESMRAALAAFSMRPTSGRRILALGEMLEVGAHSDAEHLALAGPIVASGADLVFLTGRGFASLKDRLPDHILTVFAERADDLDNEIKSVLQDGDLFMLKGSNASGMARLAGRLIDWGQSKRDQTIKGSGVPAVGDLNAL